MTPFSKFTIPSQTTLSHSVPGSPVNKTFSSWNQTMFFFFCFFCRGVVNRGLNVFWIINQTHLLHFKMKTKDLGAWKYLYTNLVYRISVHSFFPVFYLFLSSVSLSSLGLPAQALWIKQLSFRGFLQMQCKDFSGLSSPVSIWRDVDRESRPRLNNSHSLKLHQ